MLQEEHHGRTCGDPSRVDKDPLPLHLLIEVEPLETTSVKRRIILMHKRRDWRGGILLRLLCSILIFTDTISSAPGDIVFHQLLF